MKTSLVLNLVIRLAGISPSIPRPQNSNHSHTYRHLEFPATEASTRTHQTELRQQLPLTHQHSKSSLGLANEGILPVATIRTSISTKHLTQELFNFRPCPCPWIRCAGRFGHTTTMRDRRSAGDRNNPKGFILISACSLRSQLMVIIHGECDAMRSAHFCAGCDRSGYR